MAAGELDELARRAKAGEPTALGDLWLALRPLLALHLRPYRCRGPEGPLEPADLEQQAFLLLAEMVRSWPGQGQFAAWCQRIFPLRLLDYRRAVLHFDERLVFQSLPPAELAQLAEQVLGPVEAPDPADVVCCRQLLSLLPAGHRRLLGWRFRDCLTFREIERLHGLPAASAQVECARAIVYLRAVAEGERPPLLRPLRPPNRRTTLDFAAAARRLWELADPAGILPPARQAAQALGLGARAYQTLVARLREAGCLGPAAGASFASHRGHRWRVVVDASEAARRLAAAIPPPPGQGSSLPGHRPGLP